MKIKTMIVFAVISALGMFVLSGLSPPAEQAAVAFSIPDTNVQPASHVEIKCLAPDVEDMVTLFGYQRRPSHGIVEAGRRGPQKNHISFTPVGQEVGVFLDTST